MIRPSERKPYPLGPYTGGTVGVRPGVRGRCDPRVQVHPRVNATPNGWTYTDRPDRVRPERVRFAFAGAARGQREASEGSELLQLPVTPGHAEEHRAGARSRDPWTQRRDRGKPACSCSKRPRKPRPWRQRKPRGFRGFGRATARERQGSCVNPARAMGGRRSVSSPRAPRDGRTSGALRCPGLSNCSRV